MFESEKTTKLPIKKNYPINLKAIDQLRESINQIDPKKIINNALNLANKKIIDNDKTKNETLEQTKKNAINSFLSEINISDKKIDKLRLVSDQKLKDYKISANLIIERTQKETKEYISQLDGINKENQMLVKKYMDLKNQFEDIQIKQKNSLSQIEQMKSSEKILTLNKPVFNDFLKQFKAKAPREIIQDIEKQKDGFKFLTGEYNSTVNKIIFNNNTHFPSCRSEFN